MPIYEYLCTDCDHKFEILVRGQSRRHCPHCDSESLERQLSVFAVSSSGLQTPNPPVGACGTCGDPRGPGSCSTN